MNVINDDNYWNGYYKSGEVPEQPSKFALFVGSSLKKGEKLLELGCGNGRDAVYFFNLGIDVTALDKCEEAVKSVIAREPKIKGVKEEMNCELRKITGETNHVYSRFSLHSISEEQQAQTLKEIYDVLKPSGSFWLEVRSVNDELFGKGEPAGRNAYVFQEHYRRFLILEEIVGELTSIGFEVIYSEEARGFAPYKDEDPLVIRIRAVKN